MNVTDGGNTEFNDKNKKLYRLVMFGWYPLNNVNIPYPLQVQVKSIHFY